MKRLHREYIVKFYQNTMSLENRKAPSHLFLIVVFCRILYYDHVEDIQRVF